MASTLFKKLISKLSNGAAVGPDGLPVQIYKYGGDIIIEAVNYIARISIDNGTVPDVLKLGWITPIWKGDNIGDPGNYRPISLTTHLSKIVERVIRLEMTEFLNSHGLIEDWQHGSRSGRGTMTQLIRQHDMLTERLAKGKNIDLIYLDFSKAFDLVDHSHS